MRSVDSCWSDDRACVDTRILTGAVITWFPHRYQLLKQPSFLVRRLQRRKFTFPFQTPYTLCNQLRMRSNLDNAIWRRKISFVNTTILAAKIRILKIFSSP